MPAPIIHAVDQPRGFFDTKNGGFVVQDPDLSKAITAKYNSFVDDRDPAAVLFQIARDHGWHEEDITLISKVTPDEFYAMFIVSVLGRQLR
jgi:hypothetical protein